MPRKVKSTIKAKSATRAVKIAQRDIVIREGYLTVAEAARRAGVNTTNIYRLMRRGKVQTVTIGEKHYVVAKSLAAYYGPIQAIRARIMEGIVDETDGK